MPPIQKLAKLDVNQAFQLDTLHQTLLGLFQQHMADPAYWRALLAPYPMTGGPYAPQNIGMGGSGAGPYSTQNLDPRMVSPDSDMINSEPTANQPYNMGAPRKTAGGITPGQRAGSLASDLFDTTSQRIRSIETAAGPNTPDVPFLNYNPSLASREPPQEIQMAPAYVGVEKTAPGRQKTGE